MEICRLNMIEDKEIIDIDYFFKKEVTFSQRKGLFFCFALALIWFLLNSVIIYFIKGSFYFISDGFKDSFLNIEFSLPIFILGILFQELIKSLLLIALAKVPFKSQLKGFSWTSFMPYIHSKYPIPLNKYRLILIIPTFVLLFLSIFSFMFYNFSFLFISIVWVFFSGYDIYASYILRKYPQNSLASDHQDSPGSVVYENPFL